MDLRRYAKTECYKPCQAAAASSFKVLPDQSKLGVMQFENSDFLFRRNNNHYDPPLHHRSNIHPI